MQREEEIIRYSDGKADDINDLRKEFKRRVEEIGSAFLAQGKTFVKRECPSCGKRTIHYNHRLISDGCVNHVETVCLECGCIWKVMKE